jgi:hypothetical protein
MSAFLTGVAGSLSAWFLIVYLAVPRVKFRALGIDDTWEHAGRWVHFELTNRSLFWPLIDVSVVIYPLSQEYGPYRTRLGVHGLLEDAIGTVLAPRLGKRPSSCHIRFEPPTDVPAVTPIEIRVAATNGISGIRRTRVITKGLRDLKT